MINIIQLDIRNKKERHTNKHYYGSDIKFYLTHNMKLDIRCDGRIILRIESILFINKNMTKRCNDFAIYTTPNHQVASINYMSELQLRTSFNGNNGGYNSIILEFMDHVSMVKITEIMKDIKKMLDSKNAEIINSFMRISIAYKNILTRYSDKDAREMNAILTKEINIQESR